MAKQINYTPPGPVAKQFIMSDAFVCGIMGPIGSGKSTAAIMKIIRGAQKQTPGADGWIRRRTAVIRNTYSELHTTTIKSFHIWIPPDVGNYRQSSPPTQIIRDESKKFEWEILFVALDRPDDVRKLLSLELSDAWINEAREIPKAILDGLTGRVGRWPQTVKDDNGKVLFGTVDAQIVMDTNPPDSDHWWYVLAERDMTTERNRQMHMDMMQIESELKKMEALRPNQPLFQFMRQPGGDDPAAENMKNLTPGYYLKARAGKDADWIKVYVNAQYGFVMDGRPVYPEYRDSVHCKEFELTDRLPLRLGFDWGLTPACIVGQLMPNGRWFIRSEIVTENMGIIRFAEEVKRHLALKYPTFKIAALHGDPSGINRGPDERTPFDLMKAAGFDVMPAPGQNKPTLRKEAFKKNLSSMIDGEPALTIHPDCNYLRKGAAGGYNYRRIQVSGDARYRDEPDKNIYSHICEATEYLFLGAGEGREIIRREPDVHRPQFALDDYNILG